VNVERYAAQDFQRAEALVKVEHADVRDPGRGSDGGLRGCRHA
jgi:hypothetical protein